MPKHLCTCNPPAPPNALPDCTIWKSRAGVTKHSRPEALYFWGYFVAMNAIWIIIPSLCLIYSITHINAAVAG
jgi:hypothetical protein